MDKRAVYSGKLAPALLLLPQLAIVLIFFYLPAGQAVRQSFQIESAFGGDAQYVWFENYRTLFSDPTYLKAAGVTAVFSLAVATLSLAIALLLATMAHRQIAGAGIYKTLLIWPYAVAPPIAGVLFLFLFQPSLGMASRWLMAMGIDWNPTLNGTHAMILVVMAATWKQISYNFLFFLAGLQSIPQSLIEAAAIDGARPARRFWTIVFPLLSPTTFYLAVVNVVYVFFETFGIVDAVTHGGPAGATTTLVFKVYNDGKSGGDLGLSAAQSVVLMILVIALTAFQFRFVERKVNY
ncbi:MAG: sn-glycerol-3-phosphate ABC transporter permease UgpA [Rhodoblastus sp.]|nr:MAG: sn-glycerol-3-phosphate ABC transporter permease UgpA [Rhodoblastus sp.]